MEVIELRGMGYAKSTATVNTGSWDLDEHATLSALRTLGACGTPELSESFGHLRGDGAGLAEKENRPCDVLVAGPAEWRVGDLNP